MKGDHQIAAESWQKFHTLSSKLPDWCSPNFYTM